MKLVYPLERDYPLTQGFGQTAWAEQYRPFGMIGHNGIDLACPTGSPVLAADEGTVQRIGRSDAGYGNHMVIAHAWGSTLYAHLSQPLLLTGEVVRRGQVIGLSGSSGNSTGPLLHFEVRPKETSSRNGYNGAVDPLPWLTPAGEGMEAQAPECDPPEAEALYAVQAEPWLNLRGEPSLKSPRVAALYKDTTVLATGAQGCWRKIQLTGWVYAAYLVKKENAPAEGSHEPA